MRCKRWVGAGLAFVMMLGAVSAQCAWATEAAPLPVEALGVVNMQAEEHTAGENNVIIPVLTGHPDEKLQQTINEQIAARLRKDELLRTLDKVKDWSGDEGAASGLHMASSATVIGSLLSMVVSIQGELYDGSVGQQYVTFNCDLLTGQEVTFADLFAQPEEAASRMETMVQEALDREGVNAYAEHAEAQPLPRESFAADARGLTLYYPGSQYKLINGNSGAFLYLYAQLEPLLIDTPITRALLALKPVAADSAKQLRQDIDAGELPGIPAKLGTPMAEYIDRYGLASDPDYTLDGPLYQFASPRMQGVRLSSAMYPKDPEDTSEAVINIRATLIDLYGILAGKSTLLDVADVLGPPDATTQVDADKAYDMLLEEGQSFWYNGQQNRLEFHGDANGLVTAVILHAGPQGD